MTLPVLYAVITGLSYYHFLLFFVLSVSFVDNSFLCVTSVNNRYSANKVAIADFALHCAMTSANCDSSSLCLIASTPLKANT